MIDDPDASYKASGANLLTTLCDNLRNVQSNIIRRTRLGDVFFDALKANFNLLPTLTPEEDSLKILGAVVPAYFALLDATVSKKDDAGAVVDASYKTWLYRHGLMSSINHLSSSGSLGSTTSVRLTTFLLGQIPAVFERMGIAIVRDFQELLPMLRAGMMDPFILVAPEMVFAVMDVLDCLIRIGRPRVEEKWWPEILRGVVGCWCNCLDEPDSKKSEVGKVMDRLKGIVKSLKAVVDQEEWEGAERLIAEEGDLRELFGR